MAWACLEDGGIREGWVSRFCRETGFHESPRPVTEDAIDRPESERTLATMVLGTLGTALQIAVVMLRGVLAESSSQQTEELLSTRDGALAAEVTDLALARAQMPDLTAENHPTTPSAAAIGRRKAM